MNFISADSLAVKLVLTLLILVLGHISARLFKSFLSTIVLRNKDSTNRKQIQSAKDKIQYSVYIIDVITIATALFYLNADISLKLYSTAVVALPNIISAILVAILGIIGVNIFVKVISDFFKTLGFSEHLRNAGISREITKISETVLKAFLYLLLFQFIMVQASLAQSTIQELATAVTWGLTFLLAGLAFYGFKDLFKNFAAGLYLKNSRSVKSNEKIYFNDERGELIDVSLFSTTVDTDDGYTMVASNSQVMDANVKFKRTRSDIKTLEDMKRYFTAQDPSYCGPASSEMALNIFGFAHDQKEIGELAGSEVGKGTIPDDLIDAVEELTDGEVLGAYVEYDKIGKLSDELKAWFDNGALVIPNFAKPVLFPGSGKAHYSLCVGVEGDELIIVDPSADTVSGGVYYADDSEMYEAMDEFEGRKRGYVVLAPEGTTAHWRIKNDLIYSDSNFYDDINKNMELRLKKIMRQGRLLKSVLPEPMHGYIEKWNREENVNRLWKPEKDDDEDKEGEQNGEDSDTSR
ncbi:MAG: mechanosensitive ion channel domain-containing protein [Candidatus Nanohaloarchaea archaeon]